MPRLTSTINPSSVAFRANTLRMQERLAEVRALEARVVAESASKLEQEDIARAGDRAREQANKLPVNTLVESGGANLMYQAEIFVDGGRTFASRARLSAAGIPQIAVVHGSSTAGGAYVPGLADYVVLMRGRSSIEHLPGRPAAGEGGHRRGRQRRRAGRRGDACRGHGAWGTPGRERAGRTGHRG